MLALILSLAGAAAGSFAALVAERVLRGEGFVSGRSRCVSCGTTLRARDLVPLVSWPLLRGRCASCGACIPAILWQAEGLGALMGFAAAWTSPDPARAVMLALWMWALLALALADLRRMRLPDALMIPAAALGLAVALVGDGSGWPPLADRLRDAMIGALAGAGTFAAIRWTYRLRTGRDGMGGGDVALSGTLGLALGAAALPMTVLLAALGGLCWAALRALAKGRRLNRLGRVPFGAALALAGAAVKLAQLRGWLP